MAETCEISLKRFPSRKMRKQVKQFVKGEEVKIKDITGQSYIVGLKRNKLVLVPEESTFGSNKDGECVVFDYLLK